MIQLPGGLDSPPAELCQYIVYEQIYLRCDRLRQIQRRVDHPRLDTP
jgi:hypothetical protein